MGDIGGAISIIMPLDVYQANERDSIAQDVLFFAVMLAVCLVVVYVALTYLVTRPLGKIRSGVDEVSEGNLDVRLSYSESSQEMSSLTTAFNDMAHELADVYAGLEDEVADRTAQLQQANEVLEQQRRQLEAVNAQLVDENQYKSDFLSMVSHELRTPLTSIVAFADLLSKHRAGADENEAKALAGIEANSQALMLMINDILEMSRLDAGRVKLSLEVVDVGDVVGIVRATVGPLAAKEHLEFTNEVAPDVPLVQGDFDKLVHVLQNLCGNAVKFTPDGGTVHLGAAFHPASSKDAVDEVWLTVADSGIGIDAADQERIFEKFVPGGFLIHPALQRYGIGTRHRARVRRDARGLCERGKRAGPGSFPLSCASLCLARFREKRQRRTRNLVAGLVAKTFRRGNNHESTHQSDAYRRRSGHSRKSSSRRRRSGLRVLRGSWRARGASAVG